MVGQPQDRRCCCGHQRLDEVPITTAVRDVHDSREVVALFAIWIFEGEVEIDVRRRKVYDRGVLCLPAAAFFRCLLQDHNRFPDDDHIVLIYPFYVSNLGNSCRSLT